MIFEMCYLWNSMTGSKSVPQREFVQALFGVFDGDGDGIVSFEEFCAVYSEGVELIGWFEFLNNEDINLNRVKAEWEASGRKKHATFVQPQRTPKQQQQPSEDVRVQLRTIQRQLEQCMELIRAERECLSFSKQNILSFYQSDSKCAKGAGRGPQLGGNQAPALWGDDDPESSSQGSPMAQWGDSDRFQSQMMSKLRQIIALSEQVKRLNA